MLLSLLLIYDPDSKAISHPLSLTVHLCAGQLGRHDYPQFTEEETKALKGW